MSAADECGGSYHARVMVDHAGEVAVAVDYQHRVYLMGLHDALHLRDLRVGMYCLAHTRDY